MKELVEAHRYTCDGCGQIQYVELDEDEVMGLTGDVIETTNTAGGLGGDWYACSRKCLLKAITNVLDRRD
jgi:hypothetical protein